MSENTSDRHTSTVDGELPRPFPDTYYIWKAVADLEKQRYTKDEIATTLRFVASDIET